MQIFSSIRYYSTLLFGSVISIICIAFSFSLFHNSHLDATLAVSPWLWVVLSFIGAALLTAPFLSKENQALTVVSFLLFGAFAGEVFYRTGFHLLLLSFILSEFISRTRTDINTNERNLISLISSCFFISYLYGFFTFLWHEFDHVIFFDILENTNSVLLSLKESGAYESAKDFIYALEFISLGIFFNIFLKKTNLQILKDSLSKAVLVAVFTIPLYLVLQISQFHSFFSLNQNAFWNFSGRYSAIFSDPNAFGLMSGVLLLLLPFLYKNFIVLIGLAVTLITVSAFSGSRTFFIFFIAFILFLIRSLYIKNKNQKKTFIITFSIFAILFSMLLLFKSPSLERITDTLSPSKISSMFESRLVFSRIALSAIYENPFHGLGLGRFYTEQERIAENLQIELTSWRDNANNYYLHMAAEQGIPGLLIILLAFYYIYSCSGGFQKEFYLKLILGVFLLSLFTGPHIFFLEVRSAFFILMILLFMSTPRSENRIAGYKILAVICILLIFCSPWWYGRNKNLGLYKEEFSEGSEPYQWTASRTIINSINPNVDFIYIRNILHPFLSEIDRNNFYTISFYDKASSRLIFSESLPVSEVKDEWLKVKIPKEANKIIFETPHPITPQKIGLSEDYRSLGIQIKIRNVF